MHIHFKTHNKIKEELKHSSKDKINNYKEKI